MPALYQPKGKDIVELLPASPGAVQQVGVLTAEMIDADIRNNPNSSISFIQFERAKVLVAAAGYAYTDMALTAWAQAKRALLLACVTEYLKLERLIRINKQMKCEEDSIFREKIQGFYWQVCQAWKALEITDEYFCSSGYEGSPVSILEGKVHDSPNDLINTY